MRRGGILLSRFRSGCRKVGIILEGRLGFLCFLGGCILRGRGWNNIRIWGCRSGGGARGGGRLDP